MGMRHKSVGLAFRRARLRGRIWRESREIWGDEVLTDLQEEGKPFWKEPLGEASANYLYRCLFFEKDACRSKKSRDSLRFEYKAFIFFNLMKQRKLTWKNPVENHALSSLPTPPEANESREAAQNQSRAISWPLHFGRARLLIARVSARTGAN